MTTTRIIGDIHGNFSEYQYLLEGHDGPSIQVGDFGIGFGQGEYWHYKVDEFHQSGNHKFIRGNHDNPAKCKEMSGWIPDGTILNDTMLIGGAWSIDNPCAPDGWYKRTPGVDWWFDEECSDEKFEEMFKLYQNKKPRIMITHDAGVDKTYKMFWEAGLMRGKIYPNRTSQWFDKFYAAHQPDFHFFGHWHHTAYKQIGNTLFICIGEHDYVDIDLNANSDVIMEQLTDKFLQNR
jgi:predicted phosphodiesterase